MSDKQVALVDDAAVKLRALFESRREALATVAASNIDPERVFAAVLQQVSRNDDLMRIAVDNPLSIYRAVHLAASWGLEPTGSIGGAHLVPYGKEVEVIADYRGLIKLAQRSGLVTKVIARVVRERDTFSVEQGTTERLVHVPYLDGDAGAPTHVYCVITLRGGDTQFDWDTWAWVQSIKRRSRAKSGPWTTDEVEMAKKSIIRRGLKLAPQAVEVQQVIVYEEEREALNASTHDAPVSIAPAAQRPALAAIRERVGAVKPAVEAVSSEQAEVIEAAFVESRPTEDTMPVDTADVEPADESLEALLDAADRDPAAVAAQEHAEAAIVESIKRDHKPRKKDAKAVEPDDADAETTQSTNAALRPSDEGECGAVPPAKMGMSEPCNQVGEHRVHRSPEGTWPKGATA